LIICLSSCRVDLVRWQENIFSSKKIERENKLKLIVEKSYFELNRTGFICPDLPGIHAFHCRLQKLISLQKLSDLLGTPIYRSGPHSLSGLVLNEPNQFGHYDPNFVKSIREYFLPAKANPSFRAITQGVYDSIIMDTARSFFIVYQKLDSNPKFFVKEAERYRLLTVENRMDPYYLDRFILFMYPAYTDNEDPYEASKFSYRKGDEFLDAQVVKELVGFWLRRKVDGTSNEFHLGLVDLLKIYDPEFYTMRTNLDPKF
jgi:hypothetical protein